MSFNSSLSKFSFLSELYARDAPESVFLAEYPSSNNDAAFYKNTEEFLIHDPYPPLNREFIKILGPHHLMCCWGDMMPVTSEVELPKCLIEHWRRIFGNAACPNWQKPDNKSRYHTLFPHESLSVEQQEIDPKVLYKLHSKEAIGKINCPQAGILGSVSPPCIMKLSHGYAGRGNFFIYSEDDELQAKNYINKHWPQAKIVINEIINDIVGDYCVQFYLDKDGEVHWIGFTEQLFNDSMRWAGGHFSYEIQDRLYSEFFDIVGAVADYLHQNEYYGVVGIDILQNKSEEFFLVDINPRLNGSTPFLIASRLFLKQGFNEGIYVPSISLNGNLENLISMVEDIDHAKIVILSAYEDCDKKQTRCHLSVNSSSIDICRDTLEHLKKLL